MRRPHSTEMRCIKAAVRRRDRHRCTRCGMTDAVHKKRYGRSLFVFPRDPTAPYTVEGCVTLCTTCRPERCWPKGWTKREVK